MTFLDFAPDSAEGVGWATANQRHLPQTGRTIGQSPRTSTRQSVSDGPPEYALHPAGLASHRSRGHPWLNGSARRGRCGIGERIPVGRRWSHADATSFRYRRASSAIHCTRPWPALPHPTTAAICNCPTIVFTSFFSSPNGSPLSRGIPRPGAHEEPLHTLRFGHVATRLAIFA